MASELDWLPDWFRLQQGQVPIPGKCRRDENAPCGTQIRSTVSVDKFWYFMVTFPSMGVHEINTHKL
eukprot:5315119-Amphidinium_carterae.1